MPRFSDLEEEFHCPYRHSCPYLEGLPTKWVWERYNKAVGLECQYEHQLEELRKQLNQAQERIEALEKANQQLKAQLEALHRRQFKPGKSNSGAAAGSEHSAPGKKRGAPKGHPPWQRARPKRIDRVVEVPAPERCPHCQGTQLEPVDPPHEHVQEDIVLEPRTVVTCYRHQSVYCQDCQEEVWQLGPGELAGAYIGPVAKATAAYMRYELQVPYRKISRFFGDIFGLKFVPASAYGFDCQIRRRGAGLYEDLRQKIRSLEVVHADETTWRHDGQGYWVWYAGNDQLAFFEFAAHRTAQVAQQILGEQFSGVLVSDAYAVYLSVHPKDWQSCLAHLQRKAKELDQELALLEGPAQDPAARRFCQQVKDLLGEACQAHRQRQSQRWSARKARQQERAFRRRLCALGPRALSYAPAEAFRKRLMGPEQKQMFTFLRHRGVAPTNNQAERSLRPVVIMRKIVQGTRSEQGLDNQSVLQSLKETAKRQGRDLLQFFQKLLTEGAERAQAALYGDSS